MTDICPECREHCEFTRTDEDGEELSRTSPLWDEADLLSECCGAPEAVMP